MTRLLTILITLLFCSYAYTSDRPGKLAKEMNPGSLMVAQLDGKAPDKKLEMPLKHTDVYIEVSGFVASATVTQEYQNPFNKPIEAVYTFPLPEDAAVDDMQMMIGQRVIKGMIKRREEARQIYEKAKEQGQRASLLEQERPNIFTQSVANIMPGDNIVIKIRYVHILKYSEGSYELVFPMVVGPRYIPGNTPVGQSGTGWSPDTNVVPDASKITPPVLSPGERTGHDISLSVKLDAGVPIQNVLSPSHKMDVQDISNHEKLLKLHASDTLPNKDFILRYEVAGKAPEIAVIPHHDDRGGFFTLIIQPQRMVTDVEVIPRELIFIVDTSGSMSGFPIEKSKEAMRKLIKGMRSTDTFNVVRFAGDTGTLWNRPKPYTTQNAEEALRFVDSFQGGGGTEMQKGIFEALNQPASEGYLRIAFLLTDGYVGDEFRILQTIEQQSRGARVFSLGVGSSVNRYLLDRAAVVGRGETFYVRQDEDSSAVIEKFFTRVDRPALGYITIDWGKLDVTQLYPAKIPDLWAGQPIRIHGRYEKGGEDTVIIHGQLGKKPYEQKLTVKLPTNEPAHESMASVWARQKVADLMDQMVAQGQTPQLIEAVTQEGLLFRLMTQWTSFVAVEEKVVNKDGKPQTVTQPVEMPEGVSYEGVFGDQRDKAMRNGAKGAGLAARAGISPPAESSAYAPAYRPAAPAANTAAPVYNRAEPAEGVMQKRGAPDASSPKEEKADTIPPPAPPTPAISTPPASESKTVADGDKEGVMKAPPHPTAKAVVIIPSFNVSFAANKKTLTDETKRELDKLAKQLSDAFKQLGSLNIWLTGHTDDKEQSSEQLARERAEEVRDYLISKGVPAQVFTLISKGNTLPVDKSGTTEGRAKNRRVEIHATS